jgi:hypothetical protein
MLLNAAAASAAVLHARWMQHAHHQDMYAYAQRSDQINPTYAFDPAQLNPQPSPHAGTCGPELDVRRGSLPSSMCAKKPGQTMTWLPT